jgi:hypothetical protein
MTRWGRRLSLTEALALFAQDALGGLLGLLAVILVALASCTPSLPIPAGCVPVWTHVVGRADREPSVWTLGILCERGAAPRLPLPGEPL